MVDGNYNDTVNMSKSLFETSEWSSKSKICAVSIHLVREEFVADFTDADFNSPLFDTSPAPCYVVDVEGNLIDFKAATNLMDQDIADEIDEMDIENPQEFMEEYVRIHKEKYDEDFAPLTCGEW